MIRVTDKQFWLHPYLKPNLDSIVYNAERDFSFLILVTGSDKTRVGKTVIAQQVAYYIAHSLGRPFTANNMLFNSSELVKRGTRESQQVYQLDEARDSITSDKRLEQKSQDLLDFFNECGKQNHVVVAVMPSYFEINKKIAVGLSDCLINVIISKEQVKDVKRSLVVEKRMRGYYQFWGDTLKKKLYLLGKKNNNDYNTVKPAFYGEFRDFWVVDREEYDKKKMEFIQRDREAEASGGLNRYARQRNALLAYLNDKINMTQEEISRILDGSMTQEAICTAIKLYKK